MKFRRDVRDLIVVQGFALRTIRVHARTDFPYPFETDHARGKRRALRPIRAGGEACGLENVAEAARDDKTRSRQRAREHLIQRGGRAVEHIVASPRRPTAALEQRVHVEVARRRELQARRTPFAFSVQDIYGRPIKIGSKFPVPAE